MFENLLLLDAAYPLVGISFGLVLGLLIGSFLNVVVYRLPVMMERDWQSQAKQILEIEDTREDNDAEESETETFNLVLPNSRCPSCNRPIRPWENIPVLSYLVLGGKCAGCKDSISIRYPLVELLTGLLTVIVVIQYGLTPAAIALACLTFGLIALALIDYDTKLLPDDITLPLLWLGLIVNYYELVTNFSSAFWGAILGYLALWSVYQTFRLMTGKEGMGYGDFKLLAVLGAWMGWELLPLIIILSSLTGAVIGGSLIALGRDRNNPIPFGPYLAIAGWIALMWGEQITRAYSEFVA
ncbi:MAG: leader peptidase (prepilin peptidase)/N-methyltransferase [Candidatus Azotimanducaceae bacterium]|jgi:leader peptidase (prepilin peptidase)/N-methyltransferase